MNHHAALIVTVAGLLISLAAGAYAHYRLICKLAGHTASETSGSTEIHDNQRSKA